MNVTKSINRADKRDRLSMTKFGKYYSDLRPWEIDVIDYIVDFDPNIHKRR
jgi:hypothetical protein